MRPVFIDGHAEPGGVPTATGGELALALRECVDAGARIINLSLAVGYPSPRVNRELAEVLDLALARGTIVVAAAGNQGTVGSTSLTRHPGVIPVVACGANGGPLPSSNLAASAGRHGLRAPGDGIPTLSPDGGLLRISGTSAATPFVVGTAALLWSLYPRATTTTVRQALIGPRSVTRQSVVPPLLDAEAAERRLRSVRHN